MEEWSALRRSGGYSHEQELFSFTQTQRGGGVVPREAHNLQAPVQFRPPQHVFKNRLSAVFGLKAAFILTEASLCRVIEYVDPRLICIKRLVASLRFNRNNIK